VCCRARVCVCRCCGSGGGRRPAIEIAEQLRDETLDEFRSRVRGQAGMTMFFIQVPSVVGTDREEVQEYRRNTVSIDAITTNPTPSDSNCRRHPYSHCTAHEHAGFSAGFGAGFGALFGAVFGAADAAEAANADAEAPTERDAVGDATGRVETAAQPSTSSDFQSGCLGCSVRSDSCIANISSSTSYSCAYSFRRCCSPRYAHRRRFGSAALSSRRVRHWV